MSFESTAEGRVGVDGADRRRKTVPDVGTADRESPSSELGPSSLYRSCPGRSGAELPMRVGWAERDEVSQVRWTATMKSLMHQSCDFEGDAGAATVLAYNQPTEPTQPSILIESANEERQVVGGLWSTTGMLCHASGMNDGCVYVRCRWWFCVARFLTSSQPRRRAKASNHWRRSWSRRAPVRRELLSPTSSLLCLTRDQVPLSQFLLPNSTAVITALY